VTIEGQPVKLTQLEFDLLQFFMTYPEKVKTREQLLKDVWKDVSEDILDRTVDAHIKRLRAKLGNARDYLQTVRGMGYRFSVTPLNDE
jgi:two-component system, OmpR family, phosphate regulon response regulator PhoB